MYYNAKYMYRSITHCDFGANPLLGYNYIYIQDSMYFP